MSEPRKNHLSIDGAQVKEDENVATYKPIPDGDSDFKAKPTLSKSKEKISDEAEEKLLEKEAEAKIVTRVDMADAKYVVGDHRNGDAKIELDANKRQFSGLTKEELLKYADDPFWVRLRWFMFVLFWALWLCMLAGAIAIIIRAPKCAAPPPKTWYEKGPLVDGSSEANLDILENELQLLKNTGVQAVFVDAGDAYEALSEPSGLKQLEDFVAKAKTYSVKVIVELTPNFVSKSHEWFRLSENRTAPYDTYFTWASGKEYDNGNVSRRNNWVSTLDAPAWEWSEERKEHYLHQYGADQPDLNFHNPSVQQEFDKVLRAVMNAGAAGVRLHKVRQALVNQSLPDDDQALGRQGGAAGADHLSYAYYQHKVTSDQPELDRLLARWSKVVEDSGSAKGEAETVFTVAEESGRAELFRSGRNVSMLRPVSAAPVTLRENVTEFVAEVRKRLGRWPALQLTVAAEDEAAEEGLASLAMLLPAAPVLKLNQLQQDDNETSSGYKLSELVAIRDDASIKHGRYELAAVPAHNSSQLLIACARWKPGHTGYVSLLNPGAAAARARLALAALPRALTVHHVTQRVRDDTNYTKNFQVDKDDVLVPAKSAVVLSYVPKEVEEQTKVDHE